jgi:hypothetical protein
VNLEERPFLRTFCMGSGTKAVKLSRQNHTGINEKSAVIGNNTSHFRHAVVDILPIVWYNIVRN